MHTSNKYTPNVSLFHGCSSPSACPSLTLFLLFFFSCAPLSSECTGSVVPSEGETARSPVHCTVPGPGTQRRPQQQQQSGKCVGSSAQAGALRGGCSRGASSPASTCYPFSCPSSPHPCSGPSSTPGGPTEPAPSIYVARS